MRGLDRWLGSYWKTRHQRRARRFGEPTHLLLCVCDHFEPKRGNASAAKATARVQEWLDKYPKLFRDFRDSSGRPPQHTFFYPEDEYEPDLVEMVASLCRQGFGEVEIHLHHDHDTSAGLRKKLIDFKHVLHERHGLLGRDKRTGEISYGFIHGNWALCNSRRDGRWCGVNDELTVLRETGCYADFTLPSAPSETQTRTINQLYWARETGREWPHDEPIQLRKNQEPPDGLLMVQGPLLLNWRKRKFGLLPGIENGNLQGSQPPSTERLADWLRADVKPFPHSDLRFVKLYTHGVQEPNVSALLGEPMVKLHAELQRMSNDDPSFRYHYVTAREMANFAIASIYCENFLDISRNYRYDCPRVSALPAPTP